ncbi:uncharacterized protein LOC115967025 [Quercus lobata]|uniref:Uncharacterized protein n=1 Tax=Quercus lobata TaxID=97700 RepID=A0A7N2KK56_QUELO|nr:uncharacterized protein LOC115967025 [Quercus lobata]
MAIHANSIECVELLLQAGADPNIRKHGVTPLESTASEGLTEMIKCLLNAGADPNVTSFIYGRPTYAYFGEKMMSSKATGRFPPEKIPCPTYFHFHLHGSYCCGGALFWGLCVLLWRNWVHSTGFCLPFCSIFESGKNAQGRQMSSFNAAP